MTDFIAHTVTDIRGGRQSWRVILSLSIPSFLAAVLLAAIQAV
jgi:hypothetical protein